MLRIIVWRALSIILSFFLIGFFSGNWHFAVGLVFTNSIFLMIAQGVFEYFWDLKFKEEGVYVKVDPLPKSLISQDAAGNEFT